MLTTRRAAIGVAAITWLAYLNSFSGDFVFDDVAEIAFNPGLSRLFPPWEAMFVGHTLPARPLPYLSFAIDRAIWGTLPFGYHLTNLVVHTISALALFEFTRLTLLSPRLQDRWGRHAVPLALVIAALWAVHPLQTQAVTYVYQRIESMAGMFCLVSMAAFARALAADRPRAWLVASGSACAAAMACKENAVVLPVLLVLYDWLFVPAATPAAWKAEAWRRRHFHAACFLTWLILTAVILTQAGQYQEFSTAKRSPWTYALTQPGVILHYLRLVLLPVGQCLDYSGWPAVEGFSVEQLPAYAAIVILVAATIYGTVRRRVWAWLGIWFFVTLAPTSSVMPVEAFVNEHRMYLPLAAVMAALVLASAAIGSELLRRLALNDAAIRRLGIAAATIAAIALVGLTHARNRTYFSRAAMWYDVLEHDPDNFHALWQFASILDQRGDEEAAVQMADRALARKPDCDVYGSLAVARLSSGDYGGAERLCRRGLERQRSALPADDRAILNTIGDLATALRLQGRITEAEELCSAAIADMRRVLGEDDAVTLTASQLIAEGLAARRDHAAAERVARDALARSRRSKGPTAPIAVNAAVALARVLDAGGKTAEARQLIEHTLDTVLRMGPRRENDPRMLEAMRAEFRDKEDRARRPADAQARP